MNVKIPGLVVTKLDSGKGFRYRVRQEGNPSKKTTVVAPTHKDFHRQYELARMGLPIDDPVKAEDHKSETLLFLFDQYLKWLHLQVKNNLMSPKTEKKRKNLLGKVIRLSGNKDISFNLSKQQVIKLRDIFSAHPTSANETVNLLSLVYEFGIERGYCKHNPAANIKPLKKPKAIGATPWTRQDMEQFCRHHPKGTMAHLVFHLLAFTGCRIGDVRILGRKHEKTRQGIKYLEWQPVKKHSAPVSLPMAQQLQEAIAAVTLTSFTYVVNSHGKQFATADALSQRFSKWCREAGLQNRTAHGIRKAVATILAEGGHSTNQIMAVMGHSEAETTAIYTKSASRSGMAAQAFKTLELLKFD